MEKNKENLEQLKQIVSDIKQAITLYNSLNPNNKLILTEADDTIQDVTDICVCVYNKCHVGLFEKINYCSTPAKDTPAIYESGLILKGINSKYIGIITTHSGFASRYDFEHEGYRVSDINGGTIYVSSCRINKMMSFDDMRLIMKKEGELGSYKLGESNSLEMQQVLEYAFSYYKLDKKHKRKKYNK